MRPITEEKFESILDFLEEYKIDVLMITDYENYRNIQNNSYTTDLLKLLNANYV